jgi:hypothetical protein
MPAEDVLLSVARLLLQTKQTFLERVDTGARQSTEIYFKKIRIDECDYRSVRFLSAALLVLCRAGDGTSWHMLVTLVGSYLAHLVFSNQSQENEMTKSFFGWPQCCPDRHGGYGTPGIGRDHVSEWHPVEFGCRCLDRAPLLR